MTEDLHKIIKNLAEIYDKESKNTFISLYINNKNDKKFIEKREKACLTFLDDFEKENFIKTLGEIKQHLKKSKDGNIAIFASNANDYISSVSLPIDINNSLVVDSSPYIRPLARIIDEWESYNLILLNSNQAKIFSVSLGKAEQQKNLSKNIMNKHKKGGWSQARFQRLRKGAIKEFHKEVIEYLEKKGDRQIVLAGPGTVKTQFENTLPEHIRNRIIGIIDADIDEEEQLIKKSLRVVFEKEEQVSHEIVIQLKNEILKDGLAVYGFDETLNAVKNGQIDVLVVEKDYKLKGCICEHCQIVKAGPIKDCPVCGGPVTEADVIEEIIEFAERTNAKIEFTDSKEISELGHIGGLLRYAI